MLKFFQQNEGQAGMVDPDMEGLARFVKETRKRKKLSLEAIRERGGPSAAWLSTLERGTITDVPKKSTLQMLAKGLGVRLYEVLEAAGEDSFSAMLEDEMASERSNDTSGYRMGDWMRAADVPGPFMPEEIEKAIINALQNLQAANDAPTRTPESVANAVPPAISFTNDLGTRIYPPTQEEKALMAEADRLDIQMGIWSQPGFWDIEPAKRRRFLRDVEGAIEETKELYRLMGREVPPSGS